jgi:hypothetical protein
MIETSLRKIALAGAAALTLAIGAVGMSTPAAAFGHGFGGHGFGGHGFYGGRGWGWGGRGWGWGGLGAGLALGAVAAAPYYYGYPYPYGYGYPYGYRYGYPGYYGRGYW